MKVLADRRGVAWNTLQLFTSCGGPEAVELLEGARIPKTEDSNVKRTLLGLKEKLNAPIPK
jgi:hypothetical protein